MKFWKRTLITIFTFFGLATTVLYTSCSNNDPCYSLKCRNEGICSNGYCECPSGFEGPQCETQTINKHIGTYYGYTKVNEKPVIIDSAFVTVSTVNSINVVVWSEDDTLKGTVKDGGFTSQPTSAGTFGNTSIHIENGKLTVYAEKVVENEKYIYTFVGHKQ